MSVPGLAARRRAAALVAGVLERGQTLAEQTGRRTGRWRRCCPRSGRGRRRWRPGRCGTSAGSTRSCSISCSGGRPRRRSNALRLAVAEMHLDGVPAHAAVDGAVRLARAGTKGRPSRRPRERGRAPSGGSGPGLWTESEDAPLPDWLAAPVAAAWGPEAVAAIAAAHRRGGAARPHGPKVGRRPRPGRRRSTPSGCRPGACGSRAGAGRPALPGFDEGAWWVQDAGGAAAGAAARRAGRAGGCSTSAPRRAARRCSSRPPARR